MTSVEQLVPTVVSKLLSRGGRQQKLRGAILVLDLRGYTRVTAAMTREFAAAPAELADILRRRFDPLIDIVTAHGGDVLWFAGDGFTSYFPVLTHLNGCDQALASAEAIVRRVSELMRDGAANAGLSRIGVGLAFGKIQLSLLVDEDEQSKPVRYFFSGSALEKAQTAESSAKFGELIADEAFAEFANCEQKYAKANGYHAVELMSEVKIRAQCKPDTSFDPVPEEYFMDRAVYRSSRYGQMRPVTSVFVSFNPPATGEQLDQWVMRSCAELGGTFCGIDTCSTGLRAVIHFGAPTAHANNTLRAAKFVSQIRALSRGRASCKAGIAAGRCFSGFNGGTRRLEYACLGESVNLAANLLASAGWGQIWCDRTVSASLANSYTLMSMGPLRFKGASEDVTVHALEEHIQRKVRAAPLAVPLFGREDELRILRDLLLNGSNAKQTQLIWIDGEPGQGKTVMVPAVTELLEIDYHWTWVHGQCQELDQVPYGPFIQVLNDYLRSGLDDRKGKLTMERALAPLLRGVDLPDPAMADAVWQLRSVLGDLLGIPYSDKLYGSLAPDVRRDAVIKAISNIIICLASIRPLVLFLDDIQWIDEESCAVIDAVVRANPALPLTFLCAARPLETGEPARFPCACPQHTLQLTDVNKDALLEMLQQRMDPGDAQAVLGDVYALSGGNPFFAEQIISLGQKVTATASGGDGLEGFRTVRFSEMPISLELTLIARLDLFNTEILAWLQMAAVIGMEFELEQLAHAMHCEVVPPRVLDEAVEAGVWLKPEDRLCRFRHGLMRSAAYELYTPQHRIQAHMRVALAMEENREDSPEHAVALARHYMAAGLKQETRRSVLAAARFARDRFQKDQAINYYSIYLEMSQTPTTDTIEARCELAVDVLAEARMYDQAVLLLETAWRHTNRLNSRFWEIQVCRYLGEIWLARGDVTKSGEFIRHAAMLVAKSDLETDVLSCSVNRAFGDWCAYGGKRKDARRSYQAAIDLAKEMNDAALEVVACHALAKVEYDLGDIDASVECYRICAAIYARLDDEVGLANIKLEQGALNAKQGMLEKAEAMLRESIHIQETVGNHRQLARAKTELASLFAFRNNVTGAITLLDEAMVHCEGNDQTRSGAVLIEMCRLYESVGDLNKAVQLAKAAKSATEPYTDILLKARARYNLMRCELLSRTQDDEWQSEMTELEALFKQYADPFYLGEFYCELAQAISKPKSLRKMWTKKARSLVETAKPRPGSRLLIALQACNA